MMRVHINCMERKNISDTRCSRSHYRHTVLTNVLQAADEVNPVQVVILSLVVSSLSGPFIYLLSSTQVKTSS